jgi:4-coumarate--CoA ligase
LTNHWNSIRSGLVSPHKKLRGGIVFVKEIPRTKTGKIIRRQLIALASKL